MEIGRSQCKKAEYCSAPLCPLDEESLEWGIWYPDEEVCYQRKIGWINNQRKIIKVDANPNYYFDYKTLNKMKIVRPGVKGDDPDFSVKNIQKLERRIEKMTPPENSVR